MFVGAQGLQAAFVLVVPDPDGFVVSAAHNEASTRVKHETTDPVVVSHLKTRDTVHRQLVFNSDKQEDGQIYQTDRTSRVPTRVMRHMPMLTSHIFMVLSLDPDRRKGPGFPLFLLCRATEEEG